MLQLLVLHSLVLLFHKKSLFQKIFDDVTACDLKSGPPPFKNPAYAYVFRQCFFQTLITID